MRGLAEKSRGGFTFFDEVFQHLFGNREVGNHAILHGANSGNVTRGPSEHLFRREPDLLNYFFPVGSAVLPYRHHRGFVQHDALTANVNKGVGGP